MSKGSKMTKQLARVKIGITSRTAKQRRKGGDSGGDAKARFLLFVGGDDTDLDSAEVVARDGVCLMPVGFPHGCQPAELDTSLSAAAIWYVRVKKITLTLMQLMTEEAGRGVQIIANPITSVFKVA